MKTENLKVLSLKNKNLIKDNDQVKKYLKKKTKAIALFCFFEIE